MNNFSSSSTRYPTFVRSSQASAASRRVLSSRRAGFTVLEVLIALVVLLIGGLAIMNLFPPALNVIRGSENREVAMAQTKGAIARLSADPATIPDAVYEDNVGTIDEFVGAVEGTRNRNSSLPQNSAAATSALDTFKHIVGERHKVLTDTSGNRFVLLNYAYSGTPAVRIEYSIEGVRILSSGVLDFSDARKAEDNSAFVAPFPAGLYYASYAWQTAATASLQGIEDEPVAYNATSMSVFSKPVFVAGPIAMKFIQQVTPLPSPTSIDGDDPFRGRLPVGNAGILTPGREVTVDYDVSNWRWMIEDTSASVTNSVNPTLRDIKLTVPDLDSTNPTSLYGLIYQAPTNYDVGASVVGTWAGTTGTGSVVDVSRTAVVYNTGAILTASRVRSCYRATHGWAQQLSVAARSYYAYNSLRNTTERWREFYWQPLSDGLGTTATSDTLYFHPGEAGKTILVSYSNGTTKFPDQIVTIGTKIEPVPTPALLGMATFAPSRKIVKAQLVDRNGDPFPADAIQSVRGVSVRARAAWVQNGDYTQEIAEMYRPLN